ncbi:MAG: M42 family metallopeptidase [candidate division Zixibacteria bacterium]|nr:M42 family metallopeptidase [candidate division Zixibacteria bacterium]
MLKELTEAHGAPGDESAVRAVMDAHLPGYAQRTTDKLGSLIATVPGRGERPRVLVGAHMDEVAWVVREITKDGYLKVFPLGGWWGHVMLAQRVIVHGSKGPVLGVVGSVPPHLLPEDARKKVVEPKDMYIDVGVADGFNVKKTLGLRNGHYVTPDSDFQIMSNPKLYLAKAFDNRVACALVCDLLQAVRPKTLPGPLIGIGSVQEEVGLRGAGTSAWAVDPDVALILDVGIARDTPGIDAPGEKLGGGVAIDVFDAGMIPNNALLQLVIDTAEKSKIKYHLSSMDRGATDAGRVHMSRSGVPSVSLGPAARYIHSHNSILHRGDYDATLKLLLAVLKRLDLSTVGSLTGQKSKANVGAKTTPRRRPQR